jgi:hypothetical protein
VNDPAPIVPLILSAEAHLIAPRNPYDPGREIDVVTDQQCVAGLKSQYETLML